MKNRATYIRVNGYVYKLAEERKPLLITHTDMDGSACAIAFLSLYPNAEVQYKDYDNIKETLETLMQSPQDTQQKYEFIVAADVCPNDQGLIEKFLGTWDDQYARYFDHHADHEYLNDWPGSSHTLDACGAVILADQLECSDEVKQFCKLIDKHDRFVKDDPLFEEALDLCRLHFLVGQKAFIERGLQMGLTDHEQAMVEGVKQEEKNQADFVLKNATVHTDKDGKKFRFCTNVESMAANDICTRDPDMDYLVSWKPTKRSISLVSADDKDPVQPLAVTLGGGGHPHASGFSTKPEVEIELLKMLGFLE